MKKTSLLDGMTARTQAQARTVKAAAQAATGRAGKGKTTGLTLRLDDDRYERLRKLAFDKRVPMHDLMLQGVDYVLGRKQ